MEDIKKSERRKYPRLESSRRINIVILKDKKPDVPSEKIAAITRNLSAGGVCFVTDEKLDPKTMIGLEVIFHSESKPIHLEGQVMWSRPIEPLGSVDRYEVGVRIFTLDKSEEVRFFKHLKYP